MTHYLLDTNHTSAAMEQGALRVRLQSSPGAQFYLPSPALGELWFMVMNSQRIDENQRRLEGTLQLMPLVVYGTDEAREFGKIRAELRRLGRPIPQIDAQIAATARVHDMVLLSADAHFQYVHDLQVQNWLPPRS